MLTITDLGCIKHNQRQFSYIGVEAEMLGDILYSLPSDGDSYTFICEHGHTHRISYNIQAKVIHAFCDVRQKNERGR